MSTIAVLGGTGYAGAHIVGVAARRGHTVTSYSRSEPQARVAGVAYRFGDLTQPTTQEGAVNGADAVVLALSPRGDLAVSGRLRAIGRDVARLAVAAGARLGVIGGAGSLRVAEGGPRVMDTPGFPDEFKPEATEMAGVLEDLRGADTRLDWFYVSPAGGFGSHAPGRSTGTYRLGGDILLVDSAGQSNISGPDLALAVVEEIENPAHRRTRFTVAY